MVGSVHLYVEVLRKFRFRNLLRQVLFVGGVLKNIKLTIFAGRWHQGGKMLLLYIAGLPE
jgi:hypothetical protein